MITQDVAQWHDQSYKQRDMELASAWAQKAGAFGTYDYTGLGWLLPRVYPQAMAESLRFYDRVGDAVHRVRREEYEVGPPLLEPLSVIREIACSVLPLLVSDETLDILEVHAA